MKRLRKTQRNISGIIILLLFILIISAIITFFVLRRHRDLYVIHYYDGQITYDLRARQDYILIEKHTGAAEPISRSVGYTRSYHHLFRQLVDGRQSPEIFIDSDRSGISEEYLYTIHALISH